MVMGGDRENLSSFSLRKIKEGGIMDFDYFYNREAERFNFLKVPEILVDGEEFKGLSAEAIILYSMLLKRTGMSFKNNWIDKEGRVFIYFTVEEIMKRRNLSKPTAIKILDELDVKKGIGLIERIRLGLGKPNIIYVKDFMSISEVKETDLLKLKTFTSEVKNIDLRSKENELQEVKTLYPNYIDNNKSEYSKRNSAICVNRRSITAMETDKKWLYRLGKLPEIISANYQCCFLRTVLGGLP